MPAWSVASSPRCISSGARICAPSTSVPTTRLVLMSPLQPCRWGCGSSERWSDLPTVTQPGIGRIHTQVYLVSGPALRSLLHGWGSHSLGPSWGAPTREDLLTLRLLGRIPKESSLPSTHMVPLGDTGQLGLTSGAGATLELGKHRANGSQMRGDHQKRGNHQPTQCSAEGETEDPGGEGLAEYHTTNMTSGPKPPPSHDECQEGPTAQGPGRGPAQSCLALRAGAGPTREDLKP